MPHGDQEGSDSHVNPQFLQQFPSNAGRQAFPILLTPTRKLPEAAKHRVIGSTCDEDVPGSVDYDAGADMTMWNRPAADFHWKLLGILMFSCLANIPQRASMAGRSLRGADRCAQLHHGLVDLAGSPRHKVLIRPGLKSAARRDACRVSLETVEPADDADDITIKRGHIESEHQAADGRRGVGSNPRQIVQFVKSPGKTPVVITIDYFRGFMGISCPGVISQSLPCLHHVPLRRLGQGLQAGKGLHPSAVIVLDRFYSCLLKH